MPDNVKEKRTYTKAPEAKIRGLIITIIIIIIHHGVNHHPFDHLQRYFLISQEYNSSLIVGLVACTK